MKASPGREERSSMQGATTVEAPDWRDEVFAPLKAAEIRQVGYIFALVFILFGVLVDQI